MLSRYHLSRSGEQDRLGAAGNDADETEWILRVLLCLLVMVGNPCGCLPRFVLGEGLRSEC